MTVEDVRARVAEIASLARDGEAAHAKEDELYQDVLRVVAAGQYDDATCRTLATEALRAADLTHGRWCA